MNELNGKLLFLRKIGEAIVNSLKNIGEWLMKYNLRTKSLINYLDIFQSKTAKLIIPYPQTYMSCIIQPVGNKRKCFLSPRNTLSRHFQENYDAIATHGMFSSDEFLNMRVWLLTVWFGYVPTTSQVFSVYFTRVIIALFYKYRPQF